MPTEEAMPTSLLDEVKKLTTDPGARRVAQAVGASSAKSYVGGGETIDALKKTKQDRRVTWCSTGGGAMLEFLEGKNLPGLLAVAE